MSTQESARGQVPVAAGAVPNAKFCEEPMPPDVCKSIRAVVEYLWRDELLHFAADPDDDHIFCHLVRIENWHRTFDGCEPLTAEQYANDEGDY